MNEDDGPFWLEIRRGERGRASNRAYNDLYQAESLSQIASFYLWLLAKMRLPNTGRLLDVSCGAGELVRLVHGRGLPAVGVDISETVARVARARQAGPGWFGVSAGEALPFPAASFDFVSSIGSLEHFVDPAQGVREMARVLRQRGLAFVLVPNTYSLLNNVWIAFRKGQTPIDHQPIQRYGARADWTRLLTANGLPPRRTIRYERPWPRVAADWGYYLHRPKEMLRLVVSPFVPTNLAFCFLFVCERA